MERPFYPTKTEKVKTSSRIRIRFILEEGPVTLGVKLKHLKLARPIHVHVFHEPQNMSVDNYHQRLAQIANTSDYSMVLMVHPTTMAVSLCPFSNRTYIQHTISNQLLNDECPPIGKLQWILSEMDDGIINRLKDSVKSVLARLIQVQYARYGDEFENVFASVPKALQNILLIQFRGTKQGHTNMNWLPNQKMGIKLLAQSLMFIHCQVDRSIRKAHQFLFEKYKILALNEGNERVVKLMQNYHDHYLSTREKESREWSDRLRTFELTLWDTLMVSQLPLFLNNIRCLIALCNSKVARLQRAERYYKLAMAMSRLNSGFGGKTIAITVSKVLDPDMMPCQNNIQHMIHELTVPPTVVKVSGIIMRI